MAKKKHDPKAKAKRQKVIAAVGGVLLLGVLAIQVPRTLKMMNPQGQSAQSSSPSTTASTTSGTPALAPPSLDGSTGAPSTSGASSASAAVTTADGISDPAGPLPPDAGQLVSFSQFKSKDPFKQQISTACGATSSQAPGVVCASGSSGSPTTAKSGTAKMTSGLTSPAKPAKKLSFAKATTATVSVNGVKSTVSVGKSFPAAAPVFSLVSLAGGSAKIGIAGGSYESGAATVTLTKGKTVTLLNTADGTRYVLRLVAAA